MPPPPRSRRATPYRGSSWTHKSMLFRLRFDAQGVHLVELVPIRLHHTRTELADADTAREILERFDAHSRALGSAYARFEQAVPLPVSPRPPREAADTPPPLERLERVRLPRRDEPRPAAIAEALPDELLRLDHRFPDGITLLGVEPHEAQVKRGYGFFLTSWWTTDRPVTGSHLVTVRLRPASGRGPVWGNRDTYRDHHPGDWSYPTDLWRPGEFVEDHYFIRGHREAAPGRHHVYLGLSTGRGPPAEVRVGEITVLP